MNWTIRDIENITEAEAQAMACETMVIKGHNIYFLDFGGHFGYSRLVYKSEHHIYHANDYELHHPGKPQEELRDWYIEGANNTLFTETEISEPLTDYDEYDRKKRYLCNYYGMQREYVTVFHVHTTEEEAVEYRKKFEGKVYDPISFAYYADVDFVKHHIKLYGELERAKENIGDDFEYWKNAFKKEMYNHEYGINWQADYDVLRVFGEITYTEADDELQQYFEQLEFSDTKQKAYRAARREYYKEIDDDF